MLNHSFFRSTALFLLPLAIAALAAAPARALVLSDSTVTDSWKLANGLEVRLRHVPRAAGVAIVVAYRAGYGYDPAGREGLAAVLADLHYLSAAGETPDRTREEMDSIRPFGWSVRTNERFALLTEVSAPDQFPGVLRQVAVRMRGVTPVARDLQDALADVRREQGNRLFARADLGLYYRVRDVALGTPDERIVRRANAEGLKSLSLKDAVEHLHRLYVPANACLAIAGDFGTLDVHKLIEQEFAAIPGGAPQPELPEAQLQPGARAMSFAGLDHSVGVVGVFAPALGDSLHPSFFLAMMSCGPWFTNKLGRPAEPLTSRFQYSLFDEPDLIRFYPPARPTETAPAEVTRQFNGLLDQFAETTLDRDSREAIRRSVGWLIGAPLPPSAKEQIRKQPGSLGTLATSMASRALWRGDEFWAGYLERFEATHRGHNTFTGWMSDPAHQATLLFTPKP